ncbi:MAG: peptidoglycan D,D-transpeptidase FtsI family protein [Bilifractor sp.]|jgi:stage V sporulation protein D (sporulation-specific penicillin-binding protein)
MSKKLVGLFLAVILALVGLAVRITYINATEGANYSRTVLSQTQQKYSSRTIPYRRGDILDRNGEILATSEKVYNLVLDCAAVNESIQRADGSTEKPHYEATIKALHDVLGISESELKDLLSSDETKNSRYQILKKGLSITEKQKFESYQNPDEETAGTLSDEELEERSQIAGVTFEDDYERVYPHSSLACDTIGFTYSSDNSADWGIEGYYSDVLNGVNGREYGYFSSDDDVEKNIVPARDGNNVVSTIDINIQQIIRDAIENFNSVVSGDSQTKGAENIAVIVMDPNNGEILGMDSTDWYDLNNPRDLSSFYSEEELSSMSDEEQLDALNSIWRNYCVSDAFEPGSTFKPVTAAAALETASVSSDDSFECDGYEKFANGETIIHCTGIHGTLTLEEALQHSCNDALMQIGAKLGSDEMLKYQKTFNFGSRTGIDLPGEASGVLFTEDTMGDVELATTSFGQGFTCTMVQEAAAFCAIINGGNYYKPHVVSEITDSNEAVVSTNEPVLEQRVISQSVSDTIREDLRSVVESGGSGQKAKVAGYSMGGKTGTAQKLPRGNGKYLVSFIGYAPVEDPQVVVYVVVDEPHADQEDNNVFATSIAHEIFTNLLPYMNIFPDESTDSSASSSDDNSALIEALNSGQDSADQGGISDTTVAEPPDGSTDTGSSQNNSLYSDGVTNEEQQQMNSQ